MSFWENRRKEIVESSNDEIIEQEKAMLKGTILLGHIKDKDIFKKEYELNPSWDKELENKFDEILRIDDPIDNSVAIVKSELKKFADEIIGERHGMKIIIDKLLKDRGIE